MSRTVAVGRDGTSPPNSMPGVRFAEFNASLTNGGGGARAAVKSFGQTGAVSIPSQIMDVEVKKKPPWAALLTVAMYELYGAAPGVVRTAECGREQPHGRGQRDGS